MKFNRRNITTSPVSIIRAWSKYISLLALFLFALLGSAIMAEENSEKDQQKVLKVKSAFLYNFIKYITFEQESKEKSFSAFNVCVLGDDPFGSVLDKMSRRKAKGKNVFVKRMQQVEQVDQCHLVYVSQSKKGSLNEVFAFVENKPIATVSDITNFVDKGGVLGFVEVDNRIGIEVNLTHARRANVRISALLLEIAKIKE